jgi:predicted CoA-binding protein
MAESSAQARVHNGEWTPPGARARREIIERSRTVAIVGASSNPARASNFVATYLLSSSADLDVFMVNPGETEILSQPVYATLGDLPVVPDIVDVFRRSADLPDVARAAVEIGTSALWIQLGLWNEEAARIGHEAGIDVVMNRCLKIEHARFHGGLHLGGFVTGIIDSRR